MKSPKFFKHAVIVVLAVILFVVAPVATHLDVFGLKGYDAVSGASINLPEQPSGDFIVLIKTSLHKDTINDWRSFFNDEEFVVIFDDINCLVAKGDEAGFQLAQRFQAQLPENQMRVRTEDSTLLVSKAETGNIDVAIFSAEMADFLKLAPADELFGITMIKISGGGN